MNAAQQILGRAGELLSGFGHPFDPRQLLQAPKPDHPGFLARALQFHRISELSTRALRDSDHNFFDGVLSQLNLSWSCPEQEWRPRIPAQGPVVVVANHPYGLAEGLILGSLLSRVRADVKFLANALLCDTVAPGSIIPIDPFAEPGSVRTNARGMRQAIEWLSAGGLLVIFPAGEVAALDLSTREVREPEWKDTAVRLIRKTGATAVPMFFHGSNSPAFHLAGLVHPRARTALLPRELINKQGRTIRLSVGHPIPAAELSECGADDDALLYLRWRTEVLVALGHAQPAVRTATRRAAHIAKPQGADAMQKEVAALPPSRILLEHNEYRVLVAGAREIPSALHEIGRLREISFRLAGEGSGRALDRDRFDDYYQHLFVWNREREEIVGAYRLARTDEVLEQHGPGGLYTSTLFRLKPKFFDTLGPALELGRSFVRPEYQKSFAALLLLWKGIHAYVAENPRYRVLFGAVSISNAYRRESRSLMASYLRRHHSNIELAMSVRSRRAFGQRPARFRDSACPLAGIDQFSGGIQDLEEDGKGLPVLLRQYLNMGGKVLGFNVDSSFSDVLDALLVVNLDEAPRRLVERYMGKEKAARFLCAG